MGCGGIQPRETDFADGAVEMMRHLKVARRTAVKARTSAMITLKQIVVTAPPELRETLHPLADQALLKRCRGWRCGTIDTPTASAKHTLRALARRWFALSVEIVDHDRHLGRLTTQTSPTLREGLGIGADTAAEMLIIFGDNPDRIHSEAADDRALYWHGSQPGRVTLSERQLRVEKPRLRTKTARQGERGEVAIPAYDAMRRDQRLADRMLAIMLNGVSPRRYETVLPAMAEQVGIGKSEVSRETIEAGTRVLQDLAERDFSKVDVLIIYLDGIQFGNHHVLAAVGVDADGKKHVFAVPLRTRR